MIKLICRVLLRYGHGRGRDLGLVNRKETPAVGHIFGSDVVSESGWRQLAFDGFKLPPPPIPLVKLPHSGRNITLGTVDRLMQLCSSQLAQLVPSVYLRWDLVQFIWLNIHLHASLRVLLVQCSGVPLLWFLRGLNFKFVQLPYQ